MKKIVYMVPKGHSGLNQAIISNFIAYGKITVSLLGSKTNRA